MWRRCENQVGGNNDGGNDGNNGGNRGKRIKTIGREKENESKGETNWRENDDASGWRESENTLHLEQLASCSRAIRIHLSGLFLRSQFSRLSCHPVFAKKLPPDCFTACEANFSRLPAFLSDLYLECVIPAGKLLNQNYPLLTSNRYSRLSRHPIDMRQSVKRNSLHSMVETVETNQPFHFIETPLPIDEAISQWESSAEEDFPPTFLFARDGIGGLFCHSVFYEICSNCGVSFSTLLDHVMWKLSEMKHPDRNRRVFAKRKRGNGPKARRFPPSVSAGRRSLTQISRFFSAPCIGPFFRVSRKTPHFPSLRKRVFWNLLPAFFPISRQL